MITNDILATIVSNVHAASPKLTTKLSPICIKFSAAEKFLREMELNGVPLRKIPIDTLLKVKSLIKSGSKAGCEKQSRKTATQKTATQIQCKRFFQKGRSVICP